MIPTSNNKKKITAASANQFDDADEDEEVPLPDTDTSKAIAAAEPEVAPTPTPPPPPPPAMATATRKDADSIASPPKRDPTTTVTSKTESSSGSKPSPNGGDFKPDPPSKLPELNIATGTTPPATPQQKKVQLQAAAAAAAGLLSGGQLGKPIGCGGGRENPLDALAFACVAEQRRSSPNPKKKAFASPPAMIREGTEVDAGGISCTDGKCYYP